MPLTKPQAEVIGSKARFRVLVSGRRFGKTFLAINELAIFARFPNKKVWYVAPTYRQAKGICWTDLVERLKYHNWISEVNNSDLTVILRNNSKISLRGADNEQSLRGVGLDFLCMDEFADITPSAWFEVLRPTLSDTQGHALFCGTPRGFGNWAYDMYVKGTNDKEWECFKYTTLEGEQVPDEEISQAKDDLDERTFQQEYMASFVNYAGMIYYNFDRKKNIVDSFNRNYETLHIGLDFNVDPMSACVAQIDKDKIHFVDEIIIYSSNTDEMVQEIRDRYGTKIRIFVYPDPACRQRKTSAGGRTDLTILQNAGFGVKCKLKHSPIRDRVNAVNSRLKSADGKRYIFISPSCKIMIKGLQRQIYKENTNIPDKEEGYDHMNDAIGYLTEIVKPLTTNYRKFKPQRWSIKQR